MERAHSMSLSRTQPRFRTESTHAIDPKGRIIIPVRFRQVLEAYKSEGVFVTRLDKALVAYPYEKWYEIEDRILSRPETSDELRRFRRFFIGAAAECPLDKQGRILIPPELRNYAQLEKDISLVGVTDHFEIWNKQRRVDEDREMQEVDMKKEEVKSEIAKLGL